MALNARDKKGILVLCLVGFAIAALLLFSLPSEEEACPACDQHYVFFDNSEGFNNLNLELMSYETGILGEIWDESPVGTEIKFFAFDTQTFEIKQIQSDKNLVKVKDPKNANELIEAKRIVAIKFRAAISELKTLIENLPKGELRQTRLFEALRHMGQLIDRHRSRWDDKSDFNYRITLISDLLQHSENFDAYQRPIPAYEDWLNKPKSSLGRANLDRVEVKIYKFERGQPYSRDLDKFWLDYWNDAGVKTFPPSVVNI